MSIEVHVFVPPRRPADRAGWQAALHAAAVPIVLDPAFDPAEAGGFCPMTIGGRPSGCEVDLEDALSLIDDYTLLDGQVDPDAAVYSLRFGGDPAAAACACGIAAALVQGFGALAFDPQEGTLTRDPAALLDAMRDCLARG